MYELFIAPLTETYFQKALIGGSIVAVVAGVVGCLVVLRRMAFLGDALSHAMIAGVAGGYLVMKLLFGAEAHAPGMLLGSLIAAVATVALISFVSRISRVKEDTAIGIMYTGIFALGVVAVSIFRHYIHIDLMHFIMGDILGVADSDLWVSAFVAAAVLTILILFFRHFQIATFDPVMAASGLDRRMIRAAIFGGTGMVGGLYLCVWLDSAGGGAIMLFCTLQFLVVLAVAPKYGLFARWMRMRNLVPQQLVEDILTTILRYGKAAPVDDITRYVHDSKGIARALRRMVQEGLLAETGGGYALTEKGGEEANKVLRAHRLWEAYLETIGTPEKELHPTAHRLEHISDGSTVEYLDEKLGNPASDPHGKSIP